ncbi:phosphatase PAP2 family protein [Moheibacter sediminis]|uniref:Undecaprenyl-diphosphatase n=1 Tax=Moheibacter sediminis TaxID=1434700 RepID=A0A1W1Z3U6_9FLAO|nr:phosphatase PAP2 family protein [Moheibacter sediminis]SMC43140.1 undecaprenyl-diphosphatase [Moheibacter sediminis]
MQEIIQLDKDLFLYLNTLGTPMWDGFWTFISERFYWVPLYIFLVYLVYRNFGWKNMFIILGLTILMIALTDQITNFFKGTFLRLRPCFTKEFEGIMRPVGCERRGAHGFTSAHASNHIALAIFLGLIFKDKIKWLIYALLVWAIVISYSRIYLGVHFPLDVICGGAMGLIFGLIFYKIYIWITKKYNLS